MAAVAGLSQTQLGRDLEAKTIDVRFRLLNRSLHPGDDVVVIAIDNQSLGMFSKHGVSWPWPRDFYARLTDYLTAAQARAVLYDILYYEPDIDRADVDATVSDSLFAEAIRTSGRVVLAAEVSADEQLRVFEGISPLLPVGAANPHHQPAYPGLTAPIENLHRSARSIGITNVAHDSDGTLRRVWLLHLHSSGYLPQFGVAAWLAGQSAPRALAVEEGQVVIGDRVVPTDSRGQYLINWYAADLPGGPFTQVPFSAVMQSAAALETGDEPVLAQDMFAGKFVIVGATAPGLLDSKRSPVGEMPGMLVWATILSNLQRGHHLRELPWGACAIMTALAVLLSGYLALRSQSLAGSSVALLVPVLVSVGGIYLWSAHGVVLAMAAPVAGALGAYLGSTTVAYLAESRAKAAIRQAFSRYLHPDLVADLVESQDTNILAPREVETTVLFSDIGDFTGYCEGRLPSEIVTQLNEYFDVLAGVILDHQGMLDKYTGDGIMAIFGAPVPRDDHATLACVAALAHRDLSVLGLTESGQPLPSLQFHRRTRIGVNSGPIVLGNIGSRRRTDYTAVGDNVNLAARLEGLNKVYGTQVIVSQATRDLVHNRILCRRLDCVRVVGRHTGTFVYELMADLDAPGDPDFDLVKRYEEALSEYQEGRWEEAHRLFRSLATSNRSDLPSQSMVARCERLMRDPPTEWDGVYGAEAK